MRKLSDSVTLGETFEMACQLGFEARALFNCMYRSDGRGVGDDEMKTGYGLPYCHEWGLGNGMNFPHRQFNYFDQDTSPFGCGWIGGYGSLEGSGNNE